MTKLNFWLFFSLNIHLFVLLLLSTFNLGTKISNPTPPAELPAISVGVLNKNLTQQDLDTVTNDAKKTQLPIKQELAEQATIKKEKINYSNLNLKAPNLEGFLNFNLSDTKFNQTSSDLNKDIEVVGKTTKGSLRILNQKSDKYFNFVERVAKRVFFKLVEQIEGNPKSFFLNTTEVIKIYYSSRGEITVSQTTGGQITSRLVKIIETYAPDPNPPKEAFKGENLPFIFIFNFRSNPQILHVMLTAGIP